MDEDSFDEIEGRLEEEYVGAGDPSCWYGYDIRRAPRRAPEESRPFEVVIFRKTGPWEGHEEVAGQKWEVDIEYRAWFSALEEARAAAEAFCEEMHWKREAEWIGFGEGLAKRLTALVARAAEELRELSKQGELSEQSIEALRKRLEALGN
jgi:hypothetical protein